MTARVLASRTNSLRGIHRAQRFRFWLERPLTQDEEVDVEPRLPDENGGAVFEPGLTSYLQAIARGEPVN